MVNKSNFCGYDLYTLSEGKLSVSVMTLGATITDLSFNGRNMVLSYPDADGYINGRSFICASIGRYGNRIGGAEFTLDGKKYDLAPNEGKNQLHGGPASYDKRIWDAEIIDDSVRFSISSPDGDNGFPGNLVMSVTFSIIKGNTLNIRFGGETDAPTVFAPTIHPYFNLDGSGSVLDASIQINSDGHLEVDGGLIPTGEVLPCSGRFDFHSSREIGTDFDDCFVLKDEYALSLEMGDVTMEMWTDFPALQVYTGGSLEPLFGKNKGIALEPEMYPDSPNHSSFPSAVLRPGDVFSKYVQYKFFN